MTEAPICDECGEAIDPPDVVVRMAQQVAATPQGSDALEWRDGLVFQYHLDCAPRELVGAWRRVD